MAVTRDQHDTIDLTGNELSCLDNFPRLERLVTLLASANSIRSLDFEEGEKLPNLEMLILQANPLDRIEALEALRMQKRLQYLSLIDCPITRVPMYRLRVIKMLPQLRVLDFQKITAKERRLAQQLDEKKLQMGSEEVLQQLDDAEAIQLTKRAKLNKKSIEEALEKATTLEEVKQLEKILATGHIPN